MPAKIAYHRPAGSGLARQVAIADYRRRPDRAVANRFYASAIWRRLRRSFLASFPLCADCQRQGRDTLAEHVHHKIDRRERPDLALVWDNLESLCVPCHAAETRRREAGKDSP